MYAISKVEENKLLNLTLKKEEFDVKNGEVLINERY